MSPYDLSNRILNKINTYLSLCLIFIIHLGYEPLRLIKSRLQTMANAEALSPLHQGDSVIIVHITAIEERNEAMFHRFD